MNRLFSRLTIGKRKDDSLITVSISKGNLLHNLSEFQKFSGTIAPVLKSNAYGHGLLEVARILENVSVPMFIIDSYFEAHTLRYNGIEKPLLIIGYTRPDSILENSLKDVSFVITTLDTLEKVQNTKKEISIHLKIDTGMNRQGITVGEIPKAKAIIKENKKLKLDGLCTHFSDADNSDKSYTKKQIDIWNDSIKQIKKEFPHIKHFHVSNTAGHTEVNKIDANLTRLGVGLYGLPSEGEVDQKVSLKPVMSIDTIITGIKKIPKGSEVGYGRVYKTKKETAIATIPFGYYEGMDRRLSNCGQVKIGNDYAPVVGRVSMNITTIDVSKFPDVSVGSCVNVVSCNTDDKNSISNIAKKCKTISYDISVHIAGHLKRVVK